MFCLLTLEAGNDMKSKLKRDVGFMNQMMGARGGYTIDANGVRHEDPKYRKYDPLIPDAYWKKK